MGGRLRQMEEKMNDGRKIEKDGREKKNERK